MGGVILSGRDKGQMLRPAYSQPCATAQQPGRTAEKVEKVEEAKEAEEAKE